MTQTCLNTTQLFRIYNFAIGKKQRLLLKLILLFTKLYTPKKKEKQREIFCTIAMFFQKKKGTYYRTHILSLPLFVLLSELLGGIGRSRNHPAAVN